jgi:DNA helicase HerA-like ATPase
MSEIIGTVISDQDTPTFETVRIKLKAGKDVKPGTLLSIPVTRNEQTTLIARVRSAYENNPNERAEDINVRDTLGIGANYPNEEDSTTIYRAADADLIEEILEVEDKVNGNTGDPRGSGKPTKRKILRSPQNLPNSGAPVYEASPREITDAIGLADDPQAGLHIGDTVSGSPSKVVLNREIVQRHLFVCGTTGSGKSYAMGVIAEEVTKHKLPIVFLDTQDEYAALVEKLGGKVVTPGKGFTIRISSLTDRELVDLVPTDSQLQKEIISVAFLELQGELKAHDREMFLLSDLLDRINQVGPNLTNATSSIDLAHRRTQILARNNLFGSGTNRANWPKLMTPCLAIKCKHLTTRNLQMVATAMLREFQDLRLRGHIPPYLMVIDEAHLFVPEGSESACKQIIREGVRIGRHHGISLALLTQSPVDIDKSTIRQCNTRLVFALEKDQLVAIQGVKSDATEEMLRSLPKMPRGTCLLSGTYESVKHTIPVRVRERTVTKDAEGGKAPDVFAEMQSKWLVEHE